MENIWFIVTILLMGIVLISGTTLTWIFLTESETRTIVLNPSEQEHEVEPATLVVELYGPNGFRVGNDVIVKNVTPVGENTQNYMTDYFGVLTVHYGDAGTGHNFIDLRNVHEGFSEERFKLTSSTSISAYLVDLDEQEHDGIYQINTIETSQRWIIPFLGILVALIALVFTIPSGMYALYNLLN